MTPQTAAGGPEGEAGPSAVWTLDIPWSLRISLNDREHWRARAAKSRSIREAVTWQVRHRRGRLLVPHCERVAAELHVTPPDNRRRDADNFVPTYKAAVDGLVPHVVDDDDPSHVEGPTIFFLPPAPAPFMALVVRRLA